MSDFLLTLACDFLAFLVLYGFLLLRRFFLGREIGGSISQAVFVAILAVVLGGVFRRVWLAWSF
ncbi:hypothetical protein D3C76_355780 [compost metagenome]